MTNNTAATIAYIDGSAPTIGNDGITILEDRTIHI